MKRVISLITVIILVVASLNLALAQRGANLENINRPEVEILIGLNHPMIGSSVKLLIQDVDLQNETSNIQSGISNNEDENDDDLDDILEDYFEDLEKHRDGLPDKEELVLEKLASPNLDAVSLYPNPATHFINVKLNNAERYEIEVYDLIGNLVISQKSNNVLNMENRLNIADLQNGVYLMHIITPTERLIKKFGVN